MAYIDRDLLLKDIEESVVFSVRAGVPSPEMRGARKIIDRIENAPTADVVEVKHGEWIPVQYTYFGLKRYECSECKDDEYWQKRYIEHKEKYCPNCGAKMDGGKEE